MQKHFRFEDLVQVYENQVVASLERSTGRDLLAEELSCLSFWLAFTEKSSLEFAEFSELLSAFRFDIPTMTDFKSEFEHILHRDAGHGELTNVGSSKKQDGKYEDPKYVFRFDLARRIFLERGL
jgi:hypothetical protein